LLSRYLCLIASCRFIDGFGETNVSLVRYYSRRAGGEGNNATHRRASGHAGGNRGVAAEDDDGNDDDGNDDDGGRAVAVYYALPRVEIQLMCGRDIRPGFDATATLEQYYVENFFSKVLDYNPRDASFEWYPAVSVSDVRDVNATQWFYPLCNQSSTTVLATMDVPGYLKWRGKGRNGGVNENSQKNSTWYMAEHLIRRVHEHTLRDYFQEHVCPADDLLLFHAQVLYWSDARSPSDHHDTHHDNNANYPSRNNPFYFDHNLYLLCGGVDELLLEEQNLVDRGFMVLCLIVGMVMVGMICTELKLPMDGPRRPRGNQDGYVIRPTRELEMV
jgi:hypothetical protein